MPSNTSKIWTKVVVPIEAYQCDLTKFATTRQFGDLFSWAGVGVLSTEELAKALRDQSSPPSTTESEDESEGRRGGSSRIR